MGRSKGSEKNLRERETESRKRVRKISLKIDFFFSNGGFTKQQTAQDPSSNSLLDTSFANRASMSSNVC